MRMAGTAERIHYFSASELKASMLFYLQVDYGNVTDAKSDK